MDYKQKYLKYKQKYLRLLKVQKGGEPFLIDILAGLAFSYLFERNQRLLQLIYTGSQPIMMQPLGNFTLNHKYRLNLFGRSGLSVLLATRLVGESQNRFHLATRIISRTHKLPEISLPTTVAPLRGHRYPVRSVAFHPWAPLLATGSNDDTVKLWRLSSDNSSATCVSTLDRENGGEGHRGFVSSVAFHPTAPLLVTGSYDRTVKLWRLVTTPDNSSATCVATLDHTNEGHSHIVSSVAFHPKAPLLATSSWDNTVKLWRLVTTTDGLISSATRVTTLERRNKGKGHIAPVNSVAFHPKALLLATGSDDNTVRLWLLSSDNSSATCVAILDSDKKGHSGPVTSVAFHPTAPLLATSSKDRTVKLWRLVTTPDGLISSADCVATLDRENGGKGHSDWVWSVAFHPWAPLLATGSSDNTVKLWQLSPDDSSATCVATLDRRNGGEGNTNSVNSVAFHPTAPLLATSSADNTVKLWKL
jgi:WD40 repeat protein